jgi:methionyl aminopeptidase
MSIETQQDLQGLLIIGRIIGLTIQEMQAQVRAGMTTGELDAVGAAVLRKYGARPAPSLVYNFPGVNCISLNEEAAHGIPGERTIRGGDLVKIDVSAELHGYFADAAVTVAVPPVPPEKQKLVDTAKAALDAALDAARAGSPINRIGEAAELAARRGGFNIVRELTGHGVGRSIHEAPNVPNFRMRAAGRPLTEGLVIAIEPHLTEGNGRIVTEADGWTIRTTDRRPVANFEHTVVITKGRPLLVTAV